ncbi:MAG: co-chaperone DjlA [Steroidobacteraceae bacterium]
MWYGKLIGALIGFIAGHGIAGAMIGAFIGHLFDVERSGGRRSGNAQSVQQLFFRTTFQMMGHIAKADGRVSEQEIQAARRVMAQFRLTEADVRRAIELFGQGKSKEFSVDACLQELSRGLGRRVDLRLMFVQIQLQTALLGAGLNPASRAILMRICMALGISAQQFAQMESMLHMHGAAGSTAQRSGASSLTEAYQVLGVNSVASDAEVTKAYRRLMNQNHPDKLVAKGLPESMMEAAQEKTRNIRSAYEVICEARGIK